MQKHINYFTLRVGSSNTILIIAMLIENSADLQMRHQKLCTLARHFSVGHFA